MSARNTAASQRVISVLRLNTESGESPSPSCVEPTSRYESRRQDRGETFGGYESNSGEGFN